MKNEKEDWCELEKENDKYKKALEEINNKVTKHQYSNEIYHEISMICKEAIK